MEASLTTGSVDGQKPAAPPDPDLTAAAKREAVAKAAKAEAEATKAALENEKATLDNEKAAKDQAFPAPASARLEGKVEIGKDVGLVADLVTHRLVEDGAREVAAELCPQSLPESARVLLVTDRELAASDWSHELVAANIEACRVAISNARDGLEEIGPRAAARAKGPRREVAAAALPVVGAAASAANSILGSLADVIGWLRADYSISARAVTVGDSPLLAAFAQHLVDKVTSVDLDGFGLLEGSPLIGAFSALLGERNELASASARVKAEIVTPTSREREDRVAALKETGAKLAQALAGKAENSQHGELANREADLRRELREIDDESAAAAAATSVADAVVASFDTLASSLTSAPPAGGRPPLLAAAVRERLHSGETKYTHVLYANLESAAGETVAKRSLFTGATLRYVGGAQLTFLLLDSEKRTVAAAGTKPLLASMRFSLRDGSNGVVDKIPLNPTP